jgi:hypothetical protein
MTDYVGAFLASPRDILHYGRKGMKWGQRIFTKGEDSGSSKSKSDAPASATKSGGSGGSAPAKKPSGNIQDNVESSASRYARLDAQAKTGNASQMTEQDLKFYNARTDALAKINKMNETKPSWLRETTTTVIQSAAQRQMQMVANGLADKYIGDPIKASIKASGSSSSDDDDD